MKRFFEWLTTSQWGLLVTTTAVVLICIIMMAYNPRPDPVMVDDSMITYIDHGQVWADTTQWYVYDQVAMLNSVEFSGLNTILGIEHVYDYDWVETAESLVIPVDSLTIVMYIKHLIRHE